MTIEFTLEKPLALVKHLQNPQNDIPNYIHIAGVSGKTSTALLLTRLLCTCSNLRIGTFIHPPLGPPPSCILLDGVPLDKAHYTELWRHVNKMDEIFDTRCTQYEKTFLVALLVFREWRCDIAVVESALGGTFDATNLLHRAPIRQLAAVLTKISSDHVKFLGESVERITSNITGIIRQTAPVIVAANQPEAVQKCLARMCLKITSPTDTYEQLSVRDFILPIPEHQVGENLDLALRTFQVIVPQLEKIANEALRKPTLGTFVSLSFPHIFKEFYYRNRHIILDTAQNKDSPFCTWLRNRVSLETVHLVLGLSEKGNDILGAMLQSLGISKQIRYSFVNFHPPEGYPWIRPANRTELCHILQRLYDTERMDPVITNHMELSKVLTDLDGDGLVIIFGSPHIVRDFYRLCGTD